MKEQIFKEDERAWFALYTKPRSEFKAELQLRSSGIESYLPSIKKVSVWSDRTKKIRSIIIPSYIFVYTSLKERTLALQQPSIVRCLYEHGRPAKIPDWEIENLRNFLNKGEKYIVMNGLVKGAKVRITAGPFAEVTGIIVEESNQKSFAVAIELLNRTIVTHFPDGSMFEVLSRPEETLIT
ncbi:MAG: UpxY family transcription antiterminator [Ignavibacteriaceae bacterium]|nr:UpxY family transcription antiterminator [Ignavibacteriaceae bacterium]